MSNYKTLFTILYVESLVSYGFLVVLSLPGMILDFGFDTILLILLGMCWTLPIILLAKILFEYVPRFIVLKITKRKRIFNFRLYFSLAILVSVFWIFGALIINDITVRQLLLPMTIGLLNMLSIYITVKLNYKHKFVEIFQEQS